MRPGPPFRILLQRIHIRLIAFSIGVFAIATAIYAQGITADAILGPNANVVLSIIAGLLAMVCALISITYRAVISRIDRLETRIDAVVMDSIARGER